MVKSILTKIYLRVGIASLAAIALSVAVILTIDIKISTVLMVLGAALFSFGSTIWQIKKSVKNGTLVAVYAYCNSTDECVNPVDKARKLYDYKFITLAADEEGNAINNETASFYIKGEKKKFLPEESYCLLFITGENREDFNERNLIGYERCKSKPTSTEVGQ